MPADGLRYERFAPTEAMAPYVEHLWVVDAPVLGEVRREILIPNGRPMVLVCLGEPGVRFVPSTGRRDQNGDAVHGIATEPVVIEQSGKSTYVGAQLMPYGLAALSPAPPLVDASLPLEAWAGAAAKRALVAAMRADGPFESAARRLEAFLAERLKPIAAQSLARLETAVAMIEEAGGSVGVDVLAGRLELSYQALYRLFRMHVGMPPKQYAAITRCYGLVGRLLADGARDGLAQLALLQGYYDQAHASKDFVRFTGVSQKTFLRSLNGIAQLMHRP